MDAGFSEKITIHQKVSAPIEPIPEQALCRQADTLAIARIEFHSQ
jgi:hypothetical protein